VDIANR